MSIHLLAMGQMKKAAAGPTGFEFISATEAISSAVSVTGHASGDLIMVAAFNDNTTAMTSATNFTHVIGRLNLAEAVDVFYAISDGTSTYDSVTVTSAEYVVACVYRPNGGTASIGASAGGTSSTSSPPVPALTLQNTDGTSWVFAAISWKLAATVTDPASLTRRQDANYDSGNSYGFVSDSNEAVSAWTSPGNWSGTFGENARVAVEMKFTAT